MVETASPLRVRVLTEADADIEDALPRKKAIVATRNANGLACVKTAVPSLLRATAVPRPLETQAIACAPVRRVMDLPTAAVPSPKAL